MKQSTGDDTQVLNERRYMNIIQDEAVPSEKFPLLDTNMSSPIRIFVYYYVTVDRCAKIDLRLQFVAIFVALNRGPASTKCSMTN